MGTALKFIGLSIATHFAIAGAEIVYSKGKEAYKKRKESNTDVKPMEDDHEETSI